jgi:acetyltransferase-like isoleucine patch superfamily enzyme
MKRVYEGEMALLKTWLIKTIFFSRRFYHSHIKGADIHRTVRIGSGVILDKTYPQGIHIGAHSFITNDVAILTHDHSTSRWRLHTYIGERCFIGMRSIILPGIKIGNDVIIGAGSIVTKDVPSNCLVAGNPARLVRENISINDDTRLNSDKE